MIFNVWEFLVPAYPGCPGKQPKKVTVLNRPVKSSWANTTIYNNNTRLTAFFQDSPGKPVPECCQSGFYSSKDNGDGGDNRSYKTCKAHVKLSPLTNQLPACLTGRMLFLSPNQQCQSIEGRLAHPKLIWESFILVMTIKGSWFHWGRVAKPLFSPLTPVQGII